MSFPTMKKLQMRTLRWVLAGALAVLVSCGGGSSSTTSDASSTSTDAGTDALQGDGSSSTQISPVVDCKVENVSIDPLTPTLWDAAGYCWGADRKVIVDIIIEMNPHLDPMNLQTNQTIKLPIDNNRAKWLTQEEYILMQDNYEGNGVEIGPGRYKVGDTGPGGGIIVYVDVAGFGNSSGDPTSIDAMCFKVACHYLEMAPTDLEGSFAWSDAISPAENYSTATADDWVLPSKDALNEMCKYAFRDTINSICNDNGDSWFFNIGGIFWHGVYRSSSEYDDFAAWSQSFGNGDQYTNLKYLTYSVRPVRAF